MSSFIWILLVSVLFGSCSQRQPNVILIMTDDQGYGDLARVQLVLKLVLT